VVVVASYTFIVEISLFSFGFSGAPDVAEKLPQLTDLVLNSCAHCQDSVLQRLYCVQ
jgi:hypothetical protein